MEIKTIVLAVAALIVGWIVYKKVLKA